METTVRKISNCQLFRQIPCVAGREGLDNRVDYVTICNSPILSLPQYNLDDYVFVITSFSPYYDSIEKMKAMIRVLVRQHVSGVCVKVDSYLKEMPQELIDLCDELGMPLFSSNNPAIPYRKIIAAVDREILDTRVQQLEADNEQYSMLYKLITSGTSITESMKTLGEQLNCNCGSISCDHKLLGYFEVDGISAEGATKWLEVAKRFSYQCIFSQDEKCNHGGVYYYKRENYLFYPCLVWGKVEGYLIVEAEWDKVKAYSEEIERSVSYLSAKLLENIMICQSQHNNVYATVDSILFHGIRDEESIRQSLALLGFEPDECYRILAFEDPESGNTKSDLADYAMYQDIMAEISRRIQAVLQFSVNKVFVMIISYPSTSKWVNDRSITEVIDLVLNEKQTKTCHAAISENQTSYKQFAKSYQNLRQTLHYGKVFSPNEKIYTYDRFEQVRIVSRILDTEQQDYIQKMIVDPILAYDKQYQANLWDTLCRCLELDNLSAAASALFIHTSTLRYRLQKIATITHQDYFSPNGRFILYTAMIMQKLISST